MRRAQQWWTSVEHYGRALLHAGIQRVEVAPLGSGRVGVVEDLLDVQQVEQVPTVG